MMRDAEAHVAEDKQRKEEAEVRNNADTLVYQTEKLLSEQADKLEGPERDKVTEALNEVKHSLDGTDIAAIKSATDALMSASQGFTQRLYEEASRQASANGAADGTAGPSSSDGDAGGDDEVVDAEIVDEPKE